MDFPVQNVADLEKFYCFGLQPRDTSGNNEIHSGIDLAATYDPSSPLAGPGSPREPEDPEIETTLYCPYEYSTAQAGLNYGSLIRLAADGSVSWCICAYLSEDGDCGICK